MLGQSALRAPDETKLSETDTDANIGLLRSAPGRSGLDLQLPERMSSFIWTGGFTLLSMVPLSLSLSLASKEAKQASVLPMRSPKSS